MSALENETARDHAQRATHFVLAPDANDAAPAALTTAQRFAIGTPGTPFVLTCKGGAAHVLAGDSTVTATTSAPLFERGTYILALPDGATDVSMLQASGDTTIGSAYKAG